MADEKFKLPRSSYEEICKIIRAYGRIEDAASLEDLAAISAVNRTGISANNAFLANIGIIEGGKAKAATSMGRSLANALEHDLPEEILKNWAILVNENEFLRTMSAAVEIRGQMESSSLESHIAYSAGEAKAQRVMTGARAVVDILRAAGVVREQDGLLIAGETASSSEAATEESSDSLEATAAKSSTQPSISFSPRSEHSGISFHIELRIDAKPSDLDGLAEKMLVFFKELGDLPQRSDNDDELSS